MKGFSQEVSSPYQSLEMHFLNVFHAGVYISGQELVNIGKHFGYDLALKNRELLLKSLLNTAHNKGELSSVLILLSQLIEKRINTLTKLSHDYPSSSEYLNSMIQRSKSSELLLKQQQRVSPYE